MRHTFLLSLALLPALCAVASAADPPFPAGTSEQRLSNLKVNLVMPEDFDGGKEHSMVVILHGAGGTSEGMAGSLRFLVEKDFVIVAPKSRGQTWSERDLGDVREIVADLKTKLNVGEGRLHGLGFSNGGWNLGPVVFDEDLKFASACWMAAGFTGGKVHKGAKKTLGALALVGAKDANRSAAEATPKLLRDKVRTVEVRVQKGKGHEWTDGEMPYYAWWLGVQEGRFVPGETLAFEWTETEDMAGATAEEGRGGFVYWYSSKDGDDELAKTFQNETTQDPAVRRYGRQLVAAKLDREEHEAVFTALKLKTTPAVVVYDNKGKRKKSLEGKFTAGKLAKALRAVAKDKSRPKK